MIIANLEDTEQVKQLKQDTVSVLKQINNTALARRLKLSSFQFSLLPWLKWPVTIYEVTVSYVIWLERLVNSQVRKWLGLPRSSSISSIGFYGNTAL